MERRQPEMVESKVSGAGLPLLAGVVILVAVVAFLFGVKVGASPAPTPSPVGSSTPVAAVQQGVVSRALWQAYLSMADSGWALCAVAEEISCQPIVAAPSDLFANFDALPFTSSERDWMVLSPISVAPGHYVLAAPVRMLEPQVAFVRVSNAGTGTLIGNVQARSNGILWADLGHLEAGRYLAVTSAVDVSQSDVEGRSIAQTFQWGSGFIVDTPR